MSEVTDRILADIKSLKDEMLPGEYTRAYEYIAQRVRDIIREEEDPYICGPECTDAPGNYIEPSKEDSYMKLLAPLVILILAFCLVFHKMTIRELYGLIHKNGSSENHNNSHIKYYYHTIVGGGRFG